MSEHTKGRLVALAVCGSQVYADLATEDGEHEIAEDVKKADARRLAACWNFCDGLQTEVIESQNAKVALEDVLEGCRSIERELAGARALLRGAVEFVQSEHGGSEFASQIQNYLDACDTLGDSNG